MDTDDLLDRLRPHKCAVVAMPTPSQGPNLEDVGIWTRAEVEWHLYPEAGMYTIIRDNVYNLSGKLCMWSSSSTQLLTGIQTMWIFTLAARRS